MIPNGISREHILEALKCIVRSGVPPERQSTRYCLVRDGRHYPPKYAVSLAHKVKTGTELSPLVFNGGMETNYLLGRLGFEVISCKCGGLRHGVTTLVAPAPAIRQPDSIHHYVQLDWRRQVERVYELLGLLPRHDFQTPLATLPRSGVYFFFEKGETVCHAGRVIDRVVRVGTHNVDGNFRSRIRQHYGYVNSLGGNKNGSVFRMHLGGALMAKANPSDPRLKEWLTNMGAADAAVEAQVSETLRDRFTFVCFRADSSKDRLNLEAGLIALFSQEQLAPPSSSWLGRHAQNEKIGTSGLWNTQHTDGERLDAPGFMRLEQLVKASIAWERLK